MACSDIIPASANVSVRTEEQGAFYQLSRHAIKSYFRFGKNGSLRTQPSHLFIYHIPKFLEHGRVY